MTTAFARHIRSTVDDFLQTVVMVDDEAFRRADPPVGPAAEAWDAGDDEASAAVQPVRLKAPPPTPPPDDLDPNATTKAFGTRGLTCAMLSPQTPEENKEVKDPLVRTAGRADLVVLDWMLNGDDGDTALKLLRGLLRHDEGVERRLRVIAVYTGEPKLQDIANRMRDVVTSVLTGYELRDDSALPQFTCGPVRVTVLAKEYINNLPDEHAPQRVPINELPDRLADEFCVLCTGLVAGATVSALTGIRQEAHRLLSALGPEMDAALLGQRVALNQPVDVERQLEALITSEIGAVIADRQVGSQAGLKRVKQWLTAQDGLAPGGLCDGVTAKERLGFLTVGLGDDRLDTQCAKTQRTKGDLRRIRARSTELFVVHRDSAVAANRAFSERMIVRTRYSKPEPVLRLGVVVERSGEYALCVQPACDSVRLTERTTFPFLRLGARGLDDLGATNFVLSDPGKDQTWTALALSAKPANLMLVDFHPNDDEVVRSRKVGGQLRFVAADNKRYRWVADLKTEHAQRTVEELARQFSRVGLTDPELLRLGG